MTDYLIKSDRVRIGRRVKSPYTETNYEELTVAEAIDGGRADTCSGTVFVEIETLNGDPVWIDKQGRWCRGRWSRPGE